MKRKNESSHCSLRQYRAYLSLAVSASAAGTTTRKATDFKDYDRTAWYAEAVSAAVDNGLFTASPAPLSTQWRHDPCGDGSNH